MTTPHQTLYLAKHSNGTTLWASGDTEMALALALRTSIRAATIDMENKIELLKGVTQFTLSTAHVLEGLPSYLRFEFCLWTIERFVILQPLDLSDVEGVEEVTL